MTPYIVIIIGGVVVIIAIVLLLISLQKKAAAPISVDDDSLQNNLNNEKIKSEIILNSIDDGVILLDKDGVIRLFNPTAGAITGWKPSEAVGIDYRSVFNFQNEKGEPSPDQFNPIYKAWATKAVSHDPRVYLLTKTGSVISLDITSTPLLDPNNNVQGIIGVFRDITRQVEKEQERVDFISTASHEMRTPVAAIEGFLALAMNDKVSKIDDKARGFLEKAHDNTKHLGKLFQDLLTSSKAEDGRLENHPALIEMSQFLENLVESLRFVAQSKNLSIEFVLGSEDKSLNTSNNNVIKPFYYVNADPDRIREVVTNIFDNAVKYTSEGKVIIALTGDEAIVQIRIQDSGAGIPPESVPHLFQKFYRVDSSTTQTVGGTGLGLFICRKIIELYNGRLWVESELGIGSTFFINLPRVPTAMIAQLQASSIKPAIPTVANTQTETSVQKN